MPQIDLAYGDSVVPFNFSSNQFTVLAKPRTRLGPLTDAEIGASLDAPIANPPLNEILYPGESVLIVVSDATRATGSARIIDLLVRRIIQSGISPSDIAIIFALGIHRPVSAAESGHLLTSFITQRIRLINHDANDPNSLVMFGETKRGTPIELNQALREFSHVIITGGISFHYFAGFTGGRKSICPGLASAETIRQTHMLALDFENGGRRAGVGSGMLKGNAVHEECNAIAELIQPSFGINAVVDERGRVVSIYAGHWRIAHETACSEYLLAHSSPIGAMRRVVIASCGGTPYDINLIQAHKSLEMATRACSEGGTILLLAQCCDGLGRSDFLKWFQAKDSHALEESLRDNYEVNGQTAWALMNKTERFHVILISELPDEDVRFMRMTPAKSLDEAITELAHEEGYVLPLGASCLPVIRDSCS